MYRWDINLLHLLALFGLAIINNVTVHCTGWFEKIYFCAILSDQYITIIAARHLLCGGI